MTHNEIKILKKEAREWGHTEHQIMLMFNTDFDWYQMMEVRQGVLDGLSNYQLEQLSNQTLPTQEMKTMRFLFKTENERKLDMLKNNVGSKICFISKSGNEKILDVISIESLDRLLRIWLRDGYNVYIDNELSIKEKRNILKLNMGVKICSFHRGDNEIMNSKTVEIISLDNLDRISKRSMCYTVAIPTRKLWDNSND